MTDLETSYNSTTQNNKGFNTMNVLSIRLETSQLIENIEMFLRGSLIIIKQDEHGKITSQKVNRGEPKANDKGIQSILNWIQLILNPQVVQGNFAVDGPSHSTMYEEYIYHVRIDLTFMILINSYNWEISDEDIEMMVDSIMNAIEPFMTRLIDNKERESYSETIKHVESNNTKDSQSGGFKLFQS